MNSLLMKEILKSGVDRKEFVDFVGLEIFVPTGEMYDLTEQAYTYSGQLYDIYGASDEFVKKTASFFKELVHKIDSTDVSFEFSYDKFFKYFELLGQQHDTELAELQRQLEQLEAEKPLIQEQKPETVPQRALNPPPQQPLYTPPPPPKSQDVRSGNNAQLQSMFIASGQTTVYPNGHHFRCEEPMWC